MKAYFTASLRGKQTYSKNYEAIVKVLKSLGYDVFSDHILDENASTIAISQTPEQKRKFYKQLVEKVKKSDMVIAEISYPSIPVGHEISYALEISKPVIALYTDGNNSILLEGIEDKRLILVQYDVDTIKDVLPKAIEDAKKEADVRFNFFVSPTILAYLDWVAQNRKVPRSVFLRDLIEKEMKKDKAFKE